MAHAETLKIVTEKSQLDLRLAVLGFWFTGLLQTDDTRNMLKAFFFFFFLLHVLRVSNIFLRNYDIF